LPAPNPPASRYEVIADPVYGYRRLEPIPSNDALEEFYENDYYESARTGARAPDLRRLLEDGGDAERERVWLQETLYDDIAAQFTSHGKGQRVLDIGCGLGDLLQWLDERGFDVRGLEPNEQAARLACERGLDVSTVSVNELVTQPGGGSAPFDAVVLLHVLEHVPNPAEMLREIHSLLEPGGLLFIWVPNDFNALQLADRKSVV
jgi:2-polyprenyl-3-methyl-5-hydroxy-6-metoxy-1,4-benzoquinol methylase